MCTRIFWHKRANGQAMLVGRALDWLRETRPDIYVLPGGMKRNDGRRGEFAWTSRHGSAVIPVRWETKTGRQVAASVEGINEKGLAGHSLLLAQGGDYGEWDGRRERLSCAQWLQFYLDSFATVKEARAHLRSKAGRSYQLVPMGMEGHRIVLQLALEDASGKSCIIEYIAGKPEPHPGRCYPVATNVLTCLAQREVLDKYKGFGGEEELPGSTHSEARFARASYYLKHLEKAPNERRAVASLMSVLRNVSQPFGLPEREARPRSAPTWWRTILNLTERVLYLETAIGPNLIWVELDKVDFGNRVQMLDITNNLDRMGDVSGYFKEAEPFQWPTAELPN